jgi:hypothetical protein
MCDREGPWLKDAVFQMDPIPLGAPLSALANMHEGFWYGLDPTGYKVMRRASHNVSWGLRLGSDNPDV